MRAQTFKWLFLKTLKSSDSPFWRSAVDHLWYRSIKGANFVHCHPDYLSQN